MRLERASACARDSEMFATEIVGDQGLGPSAWPAAFWRYAFHDRVRHFHSIGSSSRWHREVPGWELEVMLE